MTHPTELEANSRRDVLVFTEYVRSLVPGSEPDGALFDRVWDTLRGALYAEMRRRGLWKVPPALFGIYGHASWSQAGAFDELVADAYTFVFLDRLPALRAQLEVKDNVEGLVFRNLRNFLHDTQKKHDPIGFKTYKVLRKAVGRLLRDGTLNVADGAAKLRGRSVLTFSSATAPVGEAVARESELEGPVRQWCDELAGAIVNARGAKRGELVGDLAARIARLPAEGIGAFRFHDLIDAVKRAVRVRWHLLGAELDVETAFEKTGDGSALRVRLVRPDRELENRDSLRHLVIDVSRRLRRESTDRRDEIGRLWRHLHRSALGSGRILSRRQLARQLGISRHRLAGHLAVLGRWVRQSEAPSSGPQPGAAARRRAS